MKLFIPLFFLSVIFFSCSSSQNNTNYKITSPCSDSLFLALKKKDTASFTPTEKSYYDKMNQKCNDLKTDESDLKISKTIVLTVAITTIVLEGFIYFLPLAPNLINRINI